MMTEVATEGVGSTSSSVTSDAQPEPGQGSIAEPSAPATQRRQCTNPCCLLALLLAQGVMVYFTLANSEGPLDEAPEVSHAYKPRDFAGAYCGMSDNWNNGLQAENFGKVSYTLNVSVIAREVMSDFICSTAAKAALVDGGLMPAEEVDQYLCDCCFEPCGKCSDGLKPQGSADAQSQTDIWHSEVQAVAARRAELTEGSAAPTAEAEAFLAVCASACAFDTSGDMRTYAYEPAKDDDLSGPYSYLQAADASALEAYGIGETFLNDMFSFQALPEAQCPYAAGYCVPVPGVAFQDRGDSDFCAMNLEDSTGEVADMFSAWAVPVSWEGAFATGGRWMDSLVRSGDVFACVFATALIVGLAFLVLLRFCALFGVVLAILGTLACFGFGGHVALLSSKQCEGANWFEVGAQAANVEAMETSASYRGKQFHTVTGKECLPWTNTDALPAFTAEAYPDADLVENFCRNPASLADAQDAIWCKVSAAVWTPAGWVSEYGWEACEPLEDNTCPDGFAVKSETARDVLRAAAWCIWSLGALWLLLLILLRKRILREVPMGRIALSAVISDPVIMLTPVFQAVLAGAWCIGWLWAAMYLLTQVSSEDTPTAAFSYEEAFGTSDSPGTCYGQSPSGFAWKSLDCEEGDNDVLRCWRCAQPRFLFDYRFGIQLAVFAWSTAVLLGFCRLLVVAASASKFSGRGRGASRLRVSLQALCMVLRYHLGSVALGSFLLPFAIFRGLLALLKASTQPVLACIAKCLTGCLAGLGLVLPNRDAYVQVALEGKGFIQSGKAAYRLTARDADRDGQRSVDTTSIRLVGTSFVVLVAVLSGYVLQRTQHKDISPTAPLIAYGVVAFLVAQAFLNVLSDVTSAALQCALEAEKAEKTDASCSVPGAFLDIFGVRRSAEAPAEASAPVDVEAPEDTPEVPLDKSADMLQTMIGKSEEGLSNTTPPPAASVANPVMQMWPARSEHATTKSEQQMAPTSTPLHASTDVNVAPAIGSQRARGPNVLNVLTDEMPGCASGRSLMKVTLSSATAAMPNYVPPIPPSERE